MLGPRTRLVCVGHVSNVLGSIHPFQEVARLAHARGALVCVDGVAYAPHRAIDVQELGADFYALSLYKVYGPHMAMLFARREAFLELGIANHFFYSPADIPGKLEPGNANYELTWGSAGVLDYLEAFGARVAPGSPGRESRDAAWTAIAAHEERLADRLLGFLRGRDDVAIIGRPEADRARRVPTISFVHQSLPSSAIVGAVDPHDIGIRYGHFYAYRLIEELGLLKQDGVVRVSMAHYNQLEEVDRLIAVLEPVLAGRVSTIPIAIAEATGFLADMRRRPGRGPRRARAGRTRELSKLAWSAREPLMSPNPCRPNGDRRQ